MEIEIIEEVIEERPVKNKYNLPPDLFSLICEKCEKADDAENPKEIYQILCTEIEIQIAQAYEYPEEDGIFPTIMQCALILEYLRKELTRAINNE